MADLRHQLKIKNRHLASLLSKPLFPKGFSGKYLDANIELEIVEDNEKAVDVMKKAIDEIPKKKKEKSKQSTKKRVLFKNKVSKKAKKVENKKP